MMMCKRITVAAAVLACLALAAPAWADSTHTCQGNSCNGGGAGSSAQSSAAAVSTSHSASTAVGVGGTASATAKGGHASADSTNVNVNAPSQSYTGSYEGYSGASVTVDGTRFDHYAPPVGAPALTSAGTGVCLGSVSIGLSGPMAGASFGITRVDAGCERRSGAALLYQMGYKDAAVRLLMKSDEVREAMQEPESKSAGIAIPPLALKTALGQERPVTVAPAAIFSESTGRPAVETVQGQ